MPSIQRTASGWRAQVYVRGTRDSRVFGLKSEAQTWAALRETELRAESGGRAGEVKTLADMLRRYSEEVSPKRRGVRWEQIRLAALEAMLPATKRLSEVSEADMAKWRDKRMQQVGNATVLREIGLLSACFEVARREWRWVKVNPLRDIAKPTKPEHRKRIISRAEIRAVVRALGYRPRGSIGSLSESVALAFLVALRTGMRAGELCGLTWGEVGESVAHLPLTKNGSARDVPLSAKAIRLMERARSLGDESVFALKVQTLDSLFRRARGRAGLSGFTFHDSRHTAATWMGRRVDVLTLCAIFGWRDPRFALVYFNPRPADIAKRL